jgi:hypothetical protein
VKEADQYGGEDEKDLDKYVIGCDKPHHFLRSLFHQPNHEKVIGPILETPQVVPSCRWPEFMKKHIKRSGKR